jgi:hypothetical protein
LTCSQLLARSAENAHPKMVNRNSGTFTSVFFVCKSIQVENAEKLALSFKLALTQDTEHRVTDVVFLKEQ